MQPHDSDGRRDYRHSHLASGDTYDANLAHDPFDAYMHRWEQHHLEDLLDRLYRGRIGRYLDFACGTGRITSVVAPRADETVGVDISSSMLSVAAQKLPTARFLCEDLTVSEIDLGSFQLITTFRFFGNAHPELRRSALVAINRRLQAGGTLIFNNHRNPSSLYNLTSRLLGRPVESDLTAAAMRRLLHGSGFEIVESRPIGAWMYRARQMGRSGSNPDGERRMERIFRSSAFVPIAPDAVIVARKVSNVV